MDIGAELKSFCFIKSESEVFDFIKIISSKDEDGKLLVFSVIAGQ